MNNNINCIQAGTLNGGVFANMFESDRRCYSVNGISPTIRTVFGEGGHKELKITEEKEVCGADRTGGHGSTDRHSWDLVSEPVICSSRGRNPENLSDRTVGAETQQRIEINENGTSNTITTVQKDNMVAEPNSIGTVTINNKSYRIRKLTPKECWRLMDYSDEDFEKAKAMGTSAQSLYKQAGNGIVVACLEGIYDKLFVHTDLTEPKQLSLF